MSQRNKKSFKGTFIAVTTSSKWGLAGVSLTKQRQTQYMPIIWVCFLVNEIGDL